MDFDGDNYEDRFVGALVKFVANDKFQTMFENFFVTHSLEFSDEEEHKLKYWDLYQKFSAMFEKQLEIFCDSLGITQAEFLKKCRDASGKDKQVQRYMDILLSSVEYGTFVSLMKLMRPVALHRLQVQEAEAKLVAGNNEDSKSPAKGVAGSKDYDNGGDNYAADSKLNDDYYPDDKADKMSK